MGKGSTSSPDPDPNIGKAALKQAETGEAWLDFAKDAYSQNLERQDVLDNLTNQITEQQLGLATDQADWSREDRERYTSVYQPIEDDYIEKATNYATENRQNEAAAEARADVQQSAANARAASERQASSLGIDPSSGRFAGIQAATDNQQALSEAQAANTARQSVRDKGLALEADVVNMGKGYASTAGAAAAGSVSASGTALSGTQATNAQALSASNVMNSGYSGAMQGYAGQANTLSNLYGLQLQQWQAEQQAQNSSMSGLLGGIGSAVGLAFSSDENLKEDFADIPDGAALDAVENMPVSEWNYKPGVADEGRHVGPMAQDFARETGRGDGHSIPVQDAIGVTMAAVQDLSHEVAGIKKAVGLNGALGVPTIPRDDRARDMRPPERGEGPGLDVMIAIPVDAKKKVKKGK
ncbi:endosialidase-like protein [Breoghania corrubedonensis]|uniref:Endosialidase-like protein n=1 Tax=Breoghania corrubedonensis TaxID=665038 RepID=A0A2T5UPY5_9HYPH|nr:tail fiber domain-containing protein [Breoghania corrubedonensis]PTW53565.1 endosialidase-like protein [Breoghania corrubedonensis]